MAILIFIMESIAVNNTFCNEGVLYIVEFG